MRKSVVEEIVSTAKLSSMPRKDGNGVACFFLEIDDLDRQKDNKFLIENNLILKRKMVIITIYHLSSTSKQEIMNTMKVLNLFLNWKN